MSRDWVHPSLRKGDGDEDEGRDGVNGIMDRKRKRSRSAPHDAEAKQDEEGGDGLAKVASGKASARVLPIMFAARQLYTDKSKRHGDFGFLGVYAEVPQISRTASAPVKMPSAATADVVVKDMPASLRSLEGAADGFKIGRVSLRNISHSNLDELERKVNEVVEAEGLRRARAYHLQCQESLSRQFAAYDAQKRAEVAELKKQLAAKGSVADLEKTIADLKAELELVKASKEDLRNKSLLINEAYQREHALYKGLLQKKAATARSSTLRGPT